MTPEQVDRLCQAGQAVQLAADVLAQLEGDLLTVLKALRSSVGEVEHIADELAAELRPAPPVRGLLRDG